MPPAIEALFAFMLAIPLYLNIYLAWPVLSGQARAARPDAAGKDRERSGRQRVSRVAS